MSAVWPSGGQVSTGQQVPHVCMLAPSEALFLCTDFLRNVAVGWNGSLVRQRGFWLLWLSSLNKKMWTLPEFLHVCLSLSFLCAASADFKCHCFLSRHGQGGYGSFQEVLEVVYEMKSCGTQMDINAYSILCCFPFWFMCFHKTQICNTSEI